MIEWGNSSDVDPDSKRFSHHHKNETDMGYSEEHGQSTVMTAETDKLGIDRYNADCNPLEISRGEELRLYLDRFKDEYAPSLAHMWHGPFREADNVEIISYDWILMVTHTGCSRWFMFRS